MGTLQAFKDIAPDLSNPMVLTGFVLLLFLGLHRSLLKAGIVPPLTAQTGGKVVQLFLRYGFLIALLVIVLGFGLAYYKAQKFLIALVVIVLGFGLAFYKEQKQSEKSLSADRHRAELAEQAKAALEKRFF